jgi:hypothetical protein
MASILVGTMAVTLAVGTLETFRRAMSTPPGGTSLREAKNWVKSPQKLTPVQSRVAVGERLLSERDEGMDEQQPHTPLLLPALTAQARAAASGGDPGIQSEPVAETPDCRQATLPEIQQTAGNWLQNRVNWLHLRKEM